MTYRQTEEEERGINPDGKVVLITGGDRDIGAAIAERYVAEGARVCIAGRRKEMLDDTVKSLPVGKAIVCFGDVSNYEDVKLVVGLS